MDMCGTSRHGLDSVCSEAEKSVTSARRLAPRSGANRALGIELGWEFANGRVVVAAIVFNTQRGIPPGRRAEVAT